MIGKKDAKTRRTLYRDCGICGRRITTSADSPWSRVIRDENGKYHNTYYCSSKCYAASYKHIGWFDGKAEQRRKEKDAKRDTKAKNRKYYEAHKEQEKARAKARYWSDPEAVRAANRFNKRKQKLLLQEA